MSPEAADLDSAAMRREEADIASRVSPSLRTDEAIQVVAAGFFGTLPRGGYYSTPVPVVGGRGSGFDAYDLVLTSQRLLAFPSDVRPLPPAFESDRSTAHVTVVRRIGPWTWVSAVFHDREIRLVIPRRFRDQLRVMTEALP